MSDILETILAQKRDEVSRLRQRLGRRGLDEQVAAQGGVRGFCGALAASAEHGAAVIAEIKRASPSRGLIRKDFKPAEIATGYEKGGAACLSVLTDEHFFQGSVAHLREARAAVAVPVIRKDFTIDELQVLEARAIGADAILLIVAALSDAQINELASAAQEYELDVLVEIHDRREMERFLKAELSGALLGINNRNLRTFETRLETTLELVQDIPDGTPVVTESGIAMPADVRRMLDAGVRRFLVGESLMRARQPGEALRELLA